ncbi:restriction endonuclease subunit S [Clostridium sp.]|uniref:restriction endonuclease subunit S n=1 Tax=Clostridium sp. TaxID=1506 RepID=UPI001A587C95|nr:restriction endonuclease subunit S [Clostridium sp.]MBK5241843.1 restriction endonuclease subunit S [Clostridium sp.]
MSYRRVSLEDISIRMFSGGTPSRKEEEYWENGNIPWLKTNQIGQYKIYETDEHITQDGLDKSSAKIVKKNSLTVAMYGDGITRGKVSIVGENLTTNQACCNIELDESKAIYNFVYYALKDKYTELRHISNGGAQQNLSVGLLKKFEISLPVLEVQKQFSSILCCLDEKIETNNQINIKLQKMAQTIFKQWFVDFDFPNEEGLPYKSSSGEMVDSELGMVPKAWKIRRLNEIIDNVKVNTKPGEHLKDRKYIPIDTMPMKSVTIKEFRSYEDAKSSLILFEKFDILIGAMRVYFHRVNLSPFKGVTRTTSFVLRSKKKRDIAYNLFLLDLDETINYADRTSKGTTMPYAIWENGLGNMKIIHPTKEIRNMFNNTVLTMLEKMVVNADENRHLQDIRDTLLPKLMNGEINL